MHLEKLKRLIIWNGGSMSEAGNSAQLSAQSNLTLEKIELKVETKP
jgi:hypothetical protein